MIESELKGWIGLSGIVLVLFIIGFVAGGLVVYLLK